jgi:hypothetical protein
MCGAELVVFSTMDGEVRKPFVQYRLAGKTVSLTLQEWITRTSAVVLIAGLFAAAMVLLGDVFSALYLMIVACVIVLTGYAYAKKYQKAGRPLGLFGQVAEDETPSAEDMKKWTK